MELSPEEIILRLMNSGWTVEDLKAVSRLRKLWEAAGCPAGS